MSPFWIGHLSSFSKLSSRAARRWRLRDPGEPPESRVHCGNKRAFGSLPYSMFQLTANLFQRRPSRIFHRFRARALRNVETCPALRTKSLAILPANCFQRNRQQNLLAQYILEQQTFPFIVADF